MSRQKEGIVFQISEERLARFMSPDAHLRSGTGNGVNGTFDACAMQAADWLAGGLGKTDAPEYQPEVPAGWTRTTKRVPAAPIAVSNAG